MFKIFESSFGVKGVFFDLSESSGRVLEGGSMSKLKQNGTSINFYV